MPDIARLSPDLPMPWGWGEIFNAAPAGLGLVDPASGAFIEVNECYARMLGRSREELVGCRWQDLTHADDLDEDLQCQEALERGEIQTLDRVKRYRRPDGSSVWAQVRVSPAAVPGTTRPLHWAWAEELGAAAGAAHHEHLLVQRLAGAERREVAARLLQVDDPARTCRWDWDPDTGRFVCSEGCYRLFGLDRRGSTSMLRDWHKAVHPQDLQRVERDVDRALRDGAPLATCYRIVLPDGSVRWIDAFWTPGRPTSAAKRHLSGLWAETTQHVEPAHDNAEQTRLALNLSLAEERLRLAAEAAEFGVFECNFLARQAHWSAKARRILGFAPPEPPFSAEGLPAWVHPGDARTYLRALQRALDPLGDGQLQVEHRIVRPDGELRWVQLCGQVRFDGKSAVSLHGVIVDQTERRLAEAQLYDRSAQLEAANDAKSAFLANMSHEIRTPLGVISGLADLLRRDAHDTRQNRRLNQLFDTTQHVLGIVNDILDLSKIEAGEFSLRPEVFRLGSVVDRVRRLFSDQAREKGLALGTSIEAALRPMLLQGDPLRLSQVLINLCSNAIKFTANGSVEVKIAALLFDDSGVLLDFSVIDSGPGVPPELQAQLFLPFVQADPSTARRFGGTGLGLAIVQRLVALMNGRIHMRSEPGRGSTFGFEVWLPRVDAGAAEAPPKAEDDEPVDLTGRHILLAEDHPLSQEILCDMLESLGCEVVLAADGQEALEIAQVRPPDLILMDVQMPGMDGLEATRRIRALPACQHIPIIALTANVFVEDRSRCLDAGMNDYLGKPISQAALARALSRWLPGLGRAPAPVPSLDGRLLAALSALPGVRFDAAWRASTAQMQAFLDLLLRFSQTQSGEIVAIRGHLAAGRGDAACEAAHALAGAAGMVGAHAVMDSARAIELALRRGQAPQETLPAAEVCLAEINRLAAALTPLLLGAGSRG